LTTAGNGVADGSSAIALVITLQPVVVNKPTNPKVVNIVLRLDFVIFIFLCKKECKAGFAGKASLALLQS
jgi:hypothetical protein